MTDNKSRYTNRQPKIYAIKFEGKTIYVGQTTMSVDARYWEHLSRARTGSVHVRRLYDHMRLNNLTGYTFEMLEVAAPETVDARESFWIEKFETRKSCNINVGGKSVRGKDHYMWGKKAHPNAIAGTIAAHKGKPLSQEWRDAISRANKGKIPFSFPVVCTTTGEEFISIVDAARKYGVSMFTIQMIVHGKSDPAKRRKLKGLDFKFKDQISLEQEPDAGQQKLE